MWEITMSFFNWRACSRSIYMLVFLSAVYSGPGYAEGVSFNEALRLAEIQAPQLQAHQAAFEGASEAVVAAGALPDPKAFIGIDNLPVDGANKFSTSADFMTMQKIGVMQDFPNDKKREARTEAANARVAQEGVELDLSRIMVRTETAAAWLNRYFLNRQLAVLEVQEKDNHLLGEVVRAQLLAGKGMAADALLPKQEVIALSNRRDDLQRDIAVADAALRRWSGIPAPVALSGDAPVFVVDPDVLRQHVQHHPELQRLKPMEDMARSELHEAEAARHPDWGVELAYQKRGPVFGDMVSFQVSADLPLFTSSRQDPQIRARQKALNSIEAEREAMQREHEANLEGDIAMVQSLQRQIDRLQKQALPLIQQKLDLQLAAYRSGRGEMSAVLAARRELRDTELQGITLQNQKQVLAARLYYLFESHDNFTAKDQQP